MSQSRSCVDFVQSTIAHTSVGLKKDMLCALLILGSLSHFALRAAEAAGCGVCQLGWHEKCHEWTYVCCDGWRQHSPTSRVLNCVFCFEVDACSFGNLSRLKLFYIQYDLRNRSVQLRNVAICITAPWIPWQWKPFLRTSSFGKFVPNCTKILVLYIMSKTSWVSSWSSEQYFTSIFLYLRMDHVCYDQCWRLNPLWVACYGDEDMVGKCKDFCLEASPCQMARQVLLRYVAYVCVRWHRELIEGPWHSGQWRKNPSFAPPAWRRCGWCPAGADRPAVGISWAGWIESTWSIVGTACLREITTTFIQIDDGISSNRFSNGLSDLDLI